MTVANMVETMWLVRYSWPVEIIYDRGGGFLGHEFKNILIDNEYGMKTKHESPGSPQANTIVKKHQVLGNLLCTYNQQGKYVDEADPWMGILAAAAFVVLFTYHKIKGKSPGQIVFGQDMILPIDHVSNWRYIRQRKQAEIDNDVFR